MIHWLVFLTLAHSRSATDTGRVALRLADGTVSSEGRGSQLRVSEITEDSEPAGASKIPTKLFLCSKYPTINALPLTLRENVKRTMELNPAFPVTWFDDRACVEYFQKLGDHELVGLFYRARAGKYRSDLCRAVYLFHEGGFYVDLDVEPRLPFLQMVDNKTTFMSAWEASGNGVLNALIGVQPHSIIMNYTLQDMFTYKGDREITPKAWYALNQMNETVEEGEEGDQAMDEDAPGWPLTITELSDPPASVTTNPWPEFSSFDPARDASLIEMQTTEFGPATLGAGLKRFFHECSAGTETKRVIDLRGCGESVRMYQEIDMDDNGQKQHLDQNVLMLALSGDHRAKDSKKFHGLRYGLFYTGSPSFFAGYSRFSECKSWGCGQSRPLYVTNYPRSTGSRHSMVHDFWSRIHHNHLWRSLPGYSLLARFGEDAFFTYAMGKLTCITLGVCMLMGFTIFHLQRKGVTGGWSITVDMSPATLRAGWGLAFCLCSIAMTFSNKMVVRGNPVLMAGLQMCFTVCVLISLGPETLGLDTMENVRNLKAWLPVPVFFVSMIVSSLSGFSHETITTCVLMGSIRPLYAIPVEMYFCGVHPTRNQYLACLMLFAGAGVYMIGSQADSKSRVTAIGIAVLTFNGLVAVIDRVYQRYLLHHEPIKANRLALMLTSNSFGILYIAVLPPLWLGEVDSMRLRASSWYNSTGYDDLALVLLSCLGGVGIGYTGLGFQKHVTASTFLAVSTGVRAVIVILDIVGMGTHANCVAVTGLVMVIFGSVWCATEDQGKKAEEKPAVEAEAAASPAEAQACLPEGDQAAADSDGGAGGGAGTGADGPPKRASRTIA